VTTAEGTYRAGLRSGLRKLVAALEVLSSVVIAIMMVLTFVDVIGRYVFAKPVFGASEIISALLAVAIFAGLGIANARDDHIVVELFDHRIRAYFPKVYDIAIQFFSISVMALIAYVLLEMAIEVHEQNTRTYVIEMPLFWIAGAVSALAAISVISQGIGIYLKLTDDPATRNGEDGS
jgi:TRAP-type C4-dicarboxylate transport system permease small subunit